MGCAASHADVAEANKASRPGSQQANGHVGKRYDEANIEQIELTEGVVQQYIQLEKEIHVLEKKNVVKKFEDKTLHADELKKTVDQLEATYKELKKQTEKEKADVDNLEQPSVRAFLKQQGTYEKKLTKMQQNHLDALNKQEVAQKELQMAKSQYERSSKIAEIYKRRADHLNDLYDKQDRLLAGIFGGKYGSDLENKLEAQLDDGLEWQQRVSLAKFKWSNGRVLLVHACTQMAFGIKRWQEVDSIEASNTRMRYFAAAEARNNFIAAGQNIQSCRVYLGKVQFPYCTEDEMADMDKCVNNAFTDIQTGENFKKSLGVYTNVHRKVASLIQWFDQVINETIIKDLEHANTEVSQVQIELREERLRLMTNKVREQLGTELKVDYENVTIEEDDDEKELLALEAERVKDGDDLPGEKLNNLLTMSQPDGRMPTPLPSGELAALPSNEALFGNIATIRQQHAKERQTIEKQQELSKAKMDQGLQEKLNSRRTRRERVKSQKEELAIAPK